VKDAWELWSPIITPSTKFVMTTTKKSQGTGSDNISEVATAAAAGKVDTLLIEAEPKFGMIINDAGSIEKKAI
jgi:hypothetical protein